MDEHTMVAAVSAYAIRHYNAGWDEVVEAWSDGDILEVVGQCRSEAGAIKAMAKALGVKIAATGYVVTTEDVDGRGQRAYKTLAAALKRFDEMAGYWPFGKDEIAERLERGWDVSAVSMYGTRVSLRFVG